MKKLILNLLVACLFAACDEKEGTETDIKPGLENVVWATVLTPGTSTPNLAFQITPNIPGGITVTSMVLYRSPAEVVKTIANPTGEKILVSLDGTPMHNTPVAYHVVFITSGNKTFQTASFNVCGTCMWTKP